MLGMNKAPDAQTKTAQQPAQPPAQEQPQDMMKQFTTNIVGSIWDGVKTPLMWVVGLGLFAYMAVTGKLGDMLNGLGNMLGFGGDDSKANAAQPPAPTTTTTQTTTQNPQTPATNQPRQAMKPQLTEDNNQSNSAMLNGKGDLIAGNKSKEKIDPLSTVKAMTFYTALTKCGPDFVKTNDGLFKDMLSNSNNDVAEKIAKLAGDEIAKKSGGKGGSARFVEEMNKLAKEKGIANSNFTNASGMPDPNMYSTAEDMAKWSFLIAKEFPVLADQYMQVNKVNTAVGAGLSGTQMDFKTGSGNGYFGSITAAKNPDAKARSGIGNFRIDTNKDGKIDSSDAVGGAFAVAEVPTGRGVNYGQFVKEILSRSRELANVDVPAAVTQFPPMETPITKPIPTKTK